MKLNHKAIDEMLELEEEEEVSRKMTKQLSKQALKSREDSNILHEKRNDLAEYNGKGRKKKF
jgi:hypothetical protein